MADTVSWAPQRSSSTELDATSRISAGKPSSPTPVRAAKGGASKKQKLEDASDCDAAQLSKAGGAAAAALLPANPALRGLDADSATSPSVELRLRSDGEVVRLRNARLREMSVPEMRSLLAVVRQRFVELLDANEQPGSLEIQQGLHHLHVGYHDLVTRTAVLNSDIFRQLQESSLEEGSESVQLPLWAEVAASLRFSSDQKAEVAKVLEGYELCLKSLLDRNLDIVQELAESKADGIYSQHFASEFVGAVNLMGALKANQQTEIAAQVELMRKCANVLTPLQTAQCVAASWPHVPNVPEILRAAAAA